MSGFKGKNWKPFKNRTGEAAPSRGGGGAAETDRKSSETTIPYLTDLSAVNMERYIDAVHQYALSSSNLAILTSWIRGRIPIVMLEHQLPRTKESLLGLMAKHHILADGSVSKVSLTAGEVRHNLIKKTVDEDRRRKSITKDAKGEIGGSIMDAESSSSDGKQSTTVGRSKDSKAKFGGSSMDAELIPRDSSAGRVAHSANRERLDKEEYIESHEFTKLDKMFSVMSISVKKANSVRNPTKFIYDTAAGCCICNSKEVFVAGSIVMIPNNQVSIVGFNTSHGPAIALGKG